MAELHETLMGRKLIEGDVPRMITALERIANALENNAKTELAKAFLTEMTESDIDISDGEVLDIVYELLLTGKQKE
tara:strand:+ start:308 stop:535 length:228 start_codon:yes stop_codon:yes gene_type:complete